MTRRRVLGIYRLFFAALTLAAIGTQLALGLQRRSFNVLNFFSYFTIESNVFAALVFLVTGAAALRGLRSEPFGALRGAATLYMTLTGIIYFLLLRGLEASLQTPTPWVNTVLHYLTPLAALTDWLVAPPERSIRFRQVRVWLLYPAVYVLYTLARGAALAWYPYPFLNPAHQGYGSVVLICLVIAAAVIGLAALLAARTRLGRSRSV